MSESMIEIPEEDKLKLGALLGRVNKARNFPVNTDASARHVQIAAEILAAGEHYAMFDDEPEHIAASMLATVAALYEARTELARLRALLPHQEGEAKP